MNSTIRKQAIQSILKRGQLKMIAKELKMSYSYLSQAFSPSTSISFTSDLARKVEALLGIEKNILDSGEQKLAPKPTPHSRGFLHLALQGRASLLRSAYPDKCVEVSKDIEVSGMKMIADLIICNEDGSIFMLGKQSESDPFNKQDAVENIIMFMALLGAQHGAIFAPDSGLGDQISPLFSASQKRSQWYASDNGKIIEHPEGLDPFFRVAGL